MAACQSEPTAPEPAPGTSAPPLPLSVGPSRPVDLANHAVLAFRPTSDGYTGGYTTHRATIRDGLVEVTPYNVSGGERQAGAALRLETTAIATDGAELGQLSDTRLEDGAVILERDNGAIEERLHNQADGLHQEWRFKSQPAGTGDLVIDVAIAGHDYTTTTANGVHVAAAPGVGFAYSHAVWISGDGAAWSIAAAYDNGRIRLTVPESVVASSVYPAVLDPTISAEVDADVPVTGTTGTNSQDPAIASDGTGYLVVWEDERNTADSDIWATRLDASGAIRDPLGIEIAQAKGKQTHPAVAWNGTSYVVAWEDFKVAGGTEADIAAATVSSATGAVTPLPAVAATSASETEPALAGGAGTALLTWSAGGDIRGALFGGSFGPAFNIAATTAVEASPAVALGADGNYLVAWSEGPADTADLRAQLVSTAGGLSGAALTISAGAGSQSAPALAFDGTNYAAVWVNNNAGRISGGSLTIMGSRVSPTGTVLDTHTEGLLTVGGVNLTGKQAIPAEPAIACVASGCTLLWQDRRAIATTSFDVYAQVLAPDFTTTTPEIALSTAIGKQLAPVFAAAGTGFVSVWTDSRDGAENTVFGGTLSGTGSVGTALPLVTGNNRQSQPAVGVASKSYDLLWSDSRTYGGQIQLARYNINGSKLSAGSTVAANGDNAQLSPAASGDLGGNTLAVWVDTRLGASKDIFAGRFTALGAALDGSGFPITTAAADQLNPSVASNGAVALVVWSDRRSGGFDVLGALVSSTGAVTVPDIAICNDPVGDQVRPSVTWDSASGQFFVVWSDNRSGVSHIFGTRVSASGAVLDGTSGIAVSNGAVGQFAPSIASDAAGSFAVWEDRKQGRDIFGSRISGGGSFTVRDPNGIAISTAAGSQTTPRIASMGTSYAVVWADDRNTQSDIFGQQITTGGALSGGEFAVSNKANDELNPTITGGAGPGTAIVAYESRRLDTSRIETRIITSAALVGGVCTSSAQCDTGFCVDGRCCNTACGGDDQTDCQACSQTRSGQPDGICSPRPTTAICRPNASTFCDVREQCDGVSTACPPDLGKNAGLTCNRNTNNPPGIGTGVCPAPGSTGPFFCE